MSHLKGNYLVVVLGNQSHQKQNFIVLWFAIGRYMYDVVEWHKNCHAVCTLTVSCASKILLFDSSN